MVSLKCVHWSAFMVYQRHTKCWENVANAGKMESIDERAVINYSFTFK